MKTMTLSLIAAAGVALAALSTAALADRGPGNGPGPALMQRFDELDTNKDGKLSAEELAALRTGHMAAADTDKDGTLTRDEMVAFRQQQAGERAGKAFDRMDADGDGRLSLAEMDSRKGPSPERMIKRADTDGDGVLSKAEVEAWMVKMKGHHGKGMGKGMGKGPESGMAD